MGVYEQRKRRRQRAAAIIRAFKDKPCADCGGRFHHAAMDCDHVRGIKLHDVWRLSMSGSLRSIDAELKKCEVVCANCHRIRSYNRRENNGRTNDQLIAMGIPTQREASPFDS